MVHTVSKFDHFSIEKEKKKKGKGFLVLQEDASTKRNNRRPTFGFFLIPSIVPQLWKGGARLHDALHATGPDLLCNTNNAKTEPNKIKECIVLY